MVQNCGGDLVGSLLWRRVPEPQARAYARLGVAVTRGLLLDLLATGDTHAVDQAMRAFIDLNEPLIRQADHG